MPAETPSPEVQPDGLATRLTRFFTSVTGVITSFLALVAAVTTLYVTLVGGDGRGAVPTGASAGIVSTTEPEDPVYARTSESVGAVTEAAPPATTLVEWRRSANAVCATLTRRIRAQLGRPPTTAEEYIYFLQVAAPLLNRARVDIAGIDAPPDGEAEISELVQHLEDRDAYVAETLNAWQTGNAAAYQRATAEVDRLDKQVSRAAAGLGARECAVGPFG